MKKHNIEALKVEVSQEIRTIAEHIPFCTTVQETKIMVERILSIHRKLIAVIESNKDSNEEINL